MATTDSLLAFTAANLECATSSYATISFRNSHPLVTFAKGASSSARFSGVLPNHYSGGGITVTLIWHGETSTTSGAVHWTGAFESLDTATSLFNDSFAGNKPVTSTVASTAGVSVYATISHANGAGIDSLPRGGAFIYEVFRHPGHAADTMPGNACIRAIHLTET